MKAQLAPNEYMQVSYRVPRSGLLWVRVSATDPISAYILDRRQWQLFQTSSPFTPLAGAQRRNEHHLLANGVPGTQVYLVFENDTTDIVGLDYQITDGSYNQ